MSLNPTPPPDPTPYPTAYAPPFYAYPHWQMPDPRAPAGRAGILMIVLGAMALLLAGCVGISAALIPTMRDNPQLAPMLAELERGGLSAVTLMTINAVVTGVIGLSFIFVGILVRRGTAAPVITALVLACLVLLLQLLGTVVMAVTGQPGTAACQLVVIVPLVILVIMLVQATGKIRAVSAMTAMYQTPMPPYGWPPHGYPAPEPEGYGYGYGAPPPRPDPQPPRPPPIEPMEGRDHI